MFNSFKEKIVQRWEKNQKRPIYGIIIFLAIMFFGSVTPASAQTFYEIIYTDNEEYENYGLMVYYNENDCTLNLRRHTANGDDFSFRTLSYSAEHVEEEGETPFLVMVSGEDDTPSFIWMWDEDLSEEEQLIPYIELDENDDAEDWIRATSCVEVDIRQLTPEYIEQYLNPNSELYKQICAAHAEVMQSDEEAETKEVAEALPTKNNNNPNKQQNAQVSVNVTGSGNVCQVSSRPKLHLFTLINSEVADIGAACATDYGNISNEMRGIAQSLGIQLKEYRVTGNNFSKAGLLNQLKQLKPSGNDIVLFMYSGHGFRFDDQKDQYPMMALTTNDYQPLEGNYVALSDIYNEICSKGARLNIVLSDCCNSMIGERRPIQGNTLFSRGNNNFSRKRLAELFFNAKGSILSTAASPGEYSWCDAAGGMFTLSFIQSLRQEISAMNSSPVEWQHVVDNTLNTALQRSTNSAEAQNGLKYMKVVKN